MEAPPDSPEVLRLFHENLAMVERIAQQVTRSMGYRLDAAEFVSFGQEGLLLAARRFDPSLGVPFTAYATFRVRGAILDGVRKLGNLPRRVHNRIRAMELADLASHDSAEETLNAAKSATQNDAQRLLDDHLAKMATAIALGFLPTRVAGGDDLHTLVGQDPDPELALLNAEQSAKLSACIESLPAEEATLLKRHYWDGERFDLVAAELGLSKSWASRLHSRALGRLAKRLRGEV